MIFEHVKNLILDLEKRENKVQIQVSVISQKPCKWLHVRFMFYLWFVLYIFTTFFASELLLGILFWHFSIVGNNCVDQQLSLFIFWGVVLSMYFQNIVSYLMTTKMIL